MSAVGADLIVESLLQFDRGEIAPVPQDGKNATYAPILKKEDGRIDWTKTAPQIYNRIRGFTPWPGSYCTFRGKTCHLWGHPETSGAAEAPRAPGELIPTAKDIYVVCGEGTRLLLESVQLEGRKKISASEFANGVRLGPGDRLD
jgi:methionyl-tRNA formyltransferase